MQSRREFLRHGATLTGAAAALSLFPPAIRRALAIPANTTISSSTTSSISSCTTTESAPPTPWLPCPRCR